MLERLAHLGARLRFDPAKVTLNWWLAMSQVAVVLLVAGGISFYAVGRLSDLADQQGLSRVELAGAMAREDLRRMNEDALTQVRVLANRPTLVKLLAQARSQELPLFLRRFCEADITINACAVFDGGKLAGAAGVKVPWKDVIAASTEQGQRFLVVPTRSVPPMLGAMAAVGGRAGAHVYVVRLLGAKLAARLSREVGVTIRLVNYRTFASAPVDALTALRTRALADGNSAAARVGALDVYAASFPLFASTGEAVALIDARLPAAQIEGAARRLNHRLLVTALILAVLAVFAGILLGQHVTSPLQALTAAAARLGRGDFSTSIPSAGAAEVGVLARTMEDMRRNLVDLTGTLRRREAEAQAVLGGIVEGVYAVDRNRKIRYLNAQAATLLGVEPAQAIGRFCGDVLRPRGDGEARPCEHRCPIVQARREGTARAVERLEAGERGLRTTVITSSGLVEGLQVQVIRDETELEAVRRARDSVLANISHEFRTPLAAQLASIELLRDRLATLGDAERMDLVLALERGTLRLTRLIDNLLESVRIESGQLGIRRQSVELGDVIDDAASLVGTLLRLRRQRLDVSLPEGLPPISGDRTRLTQMLVNLLANANKFAPEESVVGVGGERTGDTITLWVEDAGPGIQVAESHAIFERFRRGVEDEPEPGGLGLGLWIVKSIVERHGGRIDVRRTASERTRFSITLPIEAPR